MAAPGVNAESSAGDEMSVEDEDYEVTEQLVLVELSGIIDSDILEKCNHKCKILGMNTEKPFLQVDKYVFAGEYEDALGTFVIFEETTEQDKACADKKDKGDGESPKPQLKYKCHTAKKLNMTRTFLTEKKEGDGDGGKVEWFHIKDDSNHSFPHMICSFAQGSEVEEESLSEGEEAQERHLNTSTEDSGNMEHSFELEKQNVESEEPTSCLQDEPGNGEPLVNTVSGEQTCKSL